MCCAQLCSFLLTAPFQKCLKEIHSCKTWQCFWKELISRCPSHFVSCGQKGVNYIGQLKKIKSLVDLTNCIKQIAKPDCQLSFSSGSVRTVPVSAYCVTPGSAGTESETGRCLLCISVSSDAGSWTIKPKTSSDDLNRAQSFIWENLNQSKVPVFVWAQAHVFVFVIPQNPVCENGSAAKLVIKWTKIRFSKFIAPEELTQN